MFPALDQELALRLDDGTTISRGLPTGLHHSMGPEGQHVSLSGVIGERVIRPVDGRARYALFLLPNFEQPLGRPVAYPNNRAAAHRLLLSAEGWMVTLDAVGERGGDHETTGGRLGLRRHAGRAAGEGGRRHVHGGGRP